jgi:hypothetical protein
VGIRCPAHATPLYPLKLALASPTRDGRSAGIVRLRTKSAESVVLFVSQPKKIIILLVPELGLSLGSLGIIVMEDREELV